MNYCNIFINAIIVVFAYFGYNYVTIVQRPYDIILKKAEYVSIIGEEDVSIAPQNLADRFITELKNLLINKSKWFIEPKSPQYKSLIVESANLLGPLAAAGVPIQRATWAMNNCSADELYSFLISPVGFRVIDPITPLEEHYKPPLLSYSVPWRWLSEGLLEVRESLIKIPLMKTREFVTFNVMRRRDKVFVSKSIYTSLLPGRSYTSGGPPPTSGNVRALNTFGFLIQDSKTCGNGKKCCVVQSVNFASDLGPPASVLYMINARAFYPGLLDRLYAVLPYMSDYYNSTR